MWNKVRTVGPYLFGVFYVGTVFAAMRQSHRDFGKYHARTAYPRFIK